MSIPSIASEGGPILVGTATTLERWRGIETDDYESLCALLDADPALKVTPIPGYGVDCIAIDFGGAGTVRVIRRGRSLVLIRAWHEDPDSDSVYTDALSAEEPSSVLIGEVDFSGDTIVIAWAAESLAGIPTSVPEPTVPKIDLAVDDSVLLHPLTQGRYCWRHSKITLPSGSVVRLVLDARSPLAPDSPPEAAPS